MEKQSSVDGCKSFFFRCNGLSLTLVVSPCSTSSRCLFRLKQDRIEPIGEAFWMGSFLAYCHAWGAWNRRWQVTVTSRIWIFWIFFSLFGFHDCSDTLEEAVDILTLGGSRYIVWLLIWSVDLPVRWSGSCLEWFLFGCQDLAKVFCRGLDCKEGCALCCVDKRQSMLQVADMRHFNSRPMKAASLKTTQKCVAEKT